MLQVVNLCVVSPVFPQAGSVNFKRFKKTYMCGQRGGTMMSVKVREQKSILKILP